MNYKVIKVSASNKARLEGQVASLEKETFYPIGDDRFQINHGEDYFAFFRRLGELHYYTIIAEETGKVVAVAAAILRTINWNDRPPEKVWYLCDLKVHPDHRGHRLSLKLLTYGFFKHVCSCRQAYMLSMNPPGGSARNKVVSLLARFRWAPIRMAGQIQIFSLNQTEWQGVEGILEKRFPGFTFYSAKGKKEIVLESTKKRMEILHLQQGPCAQKAVQSELSDDNVFMFSLDEKDPLVKTLEKTGLCPMGTASILSLNYSPKDWSFILTSDI